MQSGCLETWSTRSRDCCYACGGAFFFSFLLLPLFICFLLTGGNAGSSQVFASSNLKTLGAVAFHCWIIFGFILGCHASSQGCRSGLFRRARSFWGHGGEIEAQACGNPPCLQDPGGRAGAVAAPSQRGIRAGNIKCRHAAVGGTAAGRVPGKADGLEFMAGLFTNHLPRLGDFLLKQQCVSSCYSDPCVYLGLKFLFSG